MQRSFGLQISDLESIESVVEQKLTFKEAERIIGRGESKYKIIKTIVIKKPVVPIRSDNGLAVVPPPPPPMSSPMSPVHLPMKIPVSPGMSGD